MVALAVLIGLLQAVSAQALQSIIADTHHSSGGDTIVFDNNACFPDCSSGWTLGASTLSLSYTTTGTDPVTIVCPVSFNAASLITVSSVTYNAVALSLVDNISASLESAHQDTECWQITGITGTHTIVVTFSGTADFVDGVVASYSGVSQASPVDSHNKGQVTTAATSITLSTTVVASNTWLHGMAWSRGGSQLSAGAGTTVRSAKNVGSLAANGDSNGTVAAGSRSLVFNGGSGTFPGGIIMSLKPGP